MIGIAASWTRLFPALARMGPLEDLRPEPCRSRRMDLDRSTSGRTRTESSGEFFYSRYDHPDGRRGEAALGELDGGTAVLFPSGTGATTALALSLLAPGDTIALADGAYFGTGGLFETLEQWGLRSRRVRPDRAAAGRRAARSGSRRRRTRS